MATSALKTDVTLAKEIQTRCGQNAYLCYSCKKCTSGCPLADHMDLTPAEMMRALQFGQIDRVLNSKTLWLCAYCETCFTRCPQKIDIPAIMDTLKQIAQERGVKPKLPSVAQFNELALRSVNMFGRVYELGLMGELNLRTGQILKDADLGLKLFKTGKLKLLPRWVRYSKPKKKARAANNTKSFTRLQTDRVKDKRVAYYPGCSQHSTGTEYDMSVRAVAQKLGLELVEPENWVCCGAGAAHAKSQELAVALPFKTLAIIEAEGDTRMTTPCAACFSRFRTAIHNAEANPALKKAVDNSIGYEYEGTVKVDNVVTTFLEDVGLEAIGAGVTKPLKDLKVVCYYGCLLTRPPAVTADEHPEYPMSMDLIVRKLGATTLDWSYKTECCGASLMLTQTNIALDLSQRILEKALEVGAEAIVVACSFCQGNLDNRQEQIERRAGKKIGLPIIYFTQLMGLAMGLTPKEVGLEKLFVSPEAMLRGKNLID
ncbi:MAG: 4Fe-4S dicluster domain-containing protein [Chloroflexi bacterium]|nr:4Fe-4S dicluster domain-containing protein [Chloroflexota bacterium]